MNPAVSGVTGIRDNGFMGMQLPSSPLAWDNPFFQLGAPFFTELKPTPLPSPYWVSVNQGLAKDLGWWQSEGTDDLALQVLTGNAQLPGMQPLASVYSGHQFGVWAGQLGDGRAILLGATASNPVLGPQEVQLKGSGPTPYSRRADGRAVLRSSIREYLASEAMHALGVPTSRALCITGSDAPVWRETLETAAVVTRLAPSFLRFGHFEHFAARGDVESLHRLLRFALSHYFPECASASSHMTSLEMEAPTKTALAAQQATELLQAVTQRTARLMAHWQAIGFCHGVMNTDNMSLLGLTLDYGPFQFLDAFVPDHICNHTDSQGRYAHDQQPRVAHWNLYRLARALMPLIQDPEHAQGALETFEPEFEATYWRLMRAKLGWQQPRFEDTKEGHAVDPPILQALLDLMATEGTDYPIFWRRLSGAVVEHQTAHPGLASPRLTALRDLFLDRPRFDAWWAQYQRLWSLAPPDGQAMLRTNPKFVLRNHLAEQAIQRAKNKDFSGVTELLHVLQTPFDEHPESETLADFPPEWAASIEISCSS